MSFFLNSPRPIGASFIGMAMVALLLAIPESSRGATVVYTIQDAYYTSQFNSGGDFFNNGGAELGMWANSGNKQTVGWRNFKTDGTGGGSDRSLQVGDVFKITVAATRAFGQIGFSLNNGGNTSTYSDRIDGSRLYFNTDNYGSWYVNRSGGNTTLGAGYTPIQSTYKDYIFTIRITSETTADAFMTVDGVDYRAYNLTMNGSAGSNISRFSIYGSDMWDGDSNDNAYWKQTTTVQDTSRVELGYYLASGTFTPGKITDGLAANSTTTTVANEVFVGGDSGSAVILNQANTYTGATTINAAATARAQNAQAFGTTAGGVTVTSGGVIEISGTTAIGNESLNLNGTGISAGGALRNTSANNSWGGLVTLQSASRINSDEGTLTLDVSSGNAITGAHNLTFGGAGSVEVKDPIATSTGTLTKDGTGTLTLTGNNTYSGETLLNNGTILVGNAGAFGTGTMTINYDTGSGTRSLASSSASNFTLNNNFNLYFNSFTLGQTSGGTGSLTLGGSGKNFYLGNDASTANRVITVNGNHEIAAAVTGGANNHIVKQGSGQLTLSGANTSTGNIYIDSGTINLSGGSLGAGNIDIGGGSANNSINSENATLKVTSGTFSRPITVNTESTSGGLSGNRTLEFANTSGTATLSGTVALEKTTTVTVSTTAAEGVLSGAISGAGGLTKTGAGTLTISGANANTFTGATTVNGGTLKLHKTSGNAIASGTGNTIAIQQGTLLLGAAAQIGDGTAINMSSGTTLDTAGFSDQVGQLRFTGSGVTATIKGLATGDNGSFIFSSLETASIANLATASGGSGGLIFAAASGQSYDFVNGFRIKLFSADIASTLTSNNFSTKISFEGASQVGAISFTGGTSTYLTVAAIPEPRVYAAAAGLVLLIGWAEFKRRRGKKLGVSR